MMESTTSDYLPWLDSSFGRKAKPSLVDGTNVMNSKLESPRATPVFPLVSKWLPPSDEHSDYWWKMVGPHFAVLLRNAGYSLEAQVEALLFVYHQVVPRLGISPGFSNPALESGDSGLSLDGTHIEYSWRWNQPDTKPEIRMVMEPFSRFADLSLFNHFIAKFYDTPQHKYLETKERSVMTNICLGFEFLGRDILPKAYFFPRKLGQIGLTPLATWEEAIATAIPQSSSMSSVFAFLKDDTLKLGLTLTPLWLGIDVISSSDARVKVYCIESRTSFESVKSVLSMGDTINIEPDMLENVWELMKAVCNLPADFPRDKDLPRAPQYNASIDGIDTAGLWGTFVYYFDIGPSREERPDIKFYIPVCHYGADDEAIASAMTKWMEYKGRGQA
ncbi:hypothetical protein EsH8_X_000011 [Colletotrichum jinshuiense]